MACKSHAATGSDAGTIAGKHDGRPPVKVPGKGVRSSRAGSLPGVMAAYPWCSVIDANAQGGAIAPRGDMVIPPFL